MVTQIVMAGLVPAIHAFRRQTKTWTPGTSPGRTRLMGTPNRYGVRCHYFRGHKLIS